MCRAGRLSTEHPTLAKTGRIGLFSRSVEERTSNKEELVEDASLEGEATQVEKNPMEGLEAERDKLKDQLLRTAADYDNFRKRSKRELSDAIRRVREDVLREILPIADNLQRAAEATASAKDVKSVADGVAMVSQQLEETINRFGIERLEAVGKPFDPNLHDAVQRMPTSEHPAGTVVAEMMPGYMMGDRLLRAAMVVVAAPLAAGESEAPSAADDGETLVDRDDDNEME